MSTSNTQRQITAAAILREAVAVSVEGGKVNWQAVAMTIAEEQSKLMSRMLVDGVPASFFSDHESSNKRQSDKWLGIAAKGDVRFYSSEEAAVSAAQSFIYNHTEKGRWTTGVEDVLVARVVWAASRGAELITDDGRSLYPYKLRQIEDQ